MSTVNLLQRIESDLTSDALVPSRELWGGADVVITKPSMKRKKLEGSSFYPDPRIVVTCHASQLSWLFEQLRDAFYAEDRLDSQTKIEFFSRLANAANRALKRSPEIDARMLCLAVLHEALAILDEMEEGTFLNLPIAVGNQIADDDTDDTLRTGFIGIEATRAFFTRRSAELDES